MACVWSCNHISKTLPMNKLQCFLLFAVCFGTSCGSKNETAQKIKGITQKEKKLQPKSDTSIKSELCATIEEDVSADNNFIYTPTLLFAWQEIESAFPDLKLEKSNSSAPIVRLMNSDAHKRSLNKGEYSSDITYSTQNGIENIEAEASFKLALTFTPEFQEFDNAVNFRGDKVAGFGIYYDNEYLASKIQILYYKDDNHFAFSVTPVEDDQELIFVKGLNNMVTFKDVIKGLDSLVALGKKEIEIHENYWKYTFANNEKLFIPDIKFQIEKNYNELVGQSFQTTQTRFILQRVWQQTGFKLSNKGAIVQSEARIGMSAKSDRPDSKHPKNLILNNTFFIIGKHSSKQNPYFIMKVANASLMKKRR